MVPSLRHAAILLPLAFSGAASPAAEPAGSCDSGMVPVGADCIAVDDLAGEIEAIVMERKEADDLTAVVVHVKVGDTTVLREAYGESMTGVPATPDMHFRNGAVAIAYLSTVLLKLVEDGTLSLDDTVSKWFPDYPKADEITLRMLITSTSGYADFVNMDLLPLYEDPFRHYTPDDLIGIGFSQPMVCDPGTCFAYAHTNFVILGEILAEASGRPVADLIEEIVLSPLGLENTRSEDTAVIQAPVLHAYTAERGVLEDSTYWDPSWTLARGAVMTTDIDDLAVSAEAIGNGTLLTEESHALQVGPETAGMGPFTDTMYYGMGLLVTEGWVAQTPSFAGYAAAMAYLPERDITIAVASTNGRDTPDTPRPTDTLFLALGALLAPDQAPKFGR